jgi:hypothetical protein
VTGDAITLGRAARIARRWKESGVAMPSGAGTGNGRELIERALTYQFDADDVCAGARRRPLHHFASGLGTWVVSAFLLRRHEQNPIHAVPSNLAFDNLRSQERHKRSASGWRGWIVLALMRARRADGAKGVSGMTSQIKMATFAFLAGLAIALLIQVPSVVDADDAKLFDASNLSNPEFLGYWTARLAAVPLIFVVIAIIATGRKAGRRGSIVSGLVAAVFVPAVSFAITWTVIAIAAAPQLYADQLTEEYPYAEASISRTIFVRGALSACAQKQQTLPENKDVPAASIDAFCSCFSNALADVITKGEIVSLGRKEAPRPDFAEKTKTASQKCWRLAEDQK